MQTLETLIPQLKAHFVDRLPEPKIKLLKTIHTDEDLRKRAERSNEHFVQMYSSGLADSVVTREKGDLKSGDWITYMNPFGNVLINCRVIGWDKHEQLYISIDCYWTPISETDVVKQQNKIIYRGYLDE